MEKDREANASGQRDEGHDRQPGSAEELAVSNRQRAAAEQALRDSEARLRAILDTAVEAIATIDEFGVIESFNLAAQRMFGFTAEEVIGQNVKILMPEPYSDEHDRYLASYRRTGQRKIIGIGREVVARRKDGTVFPIDLAVSEVQLGGRRIFTGIMRDISERKDAERERERLLEAERSAREQLEAVVKELEAFSYSVSHDLRAPLRTIEAFSSILVKDFSRDLPSDALRYLSLVSGSARKMDELITSLLAFSRLSRRELTRQAVDLGGLAREIIEELRVQYENRDAAFTVGSLPTCLADPVLIRQVLVNLLSNAIKYTGKCEHAEIAVGSELVGDETAIWVRDNGVGFDMRYADKLFKVFQRLHREEEFEGAGVGLAIVQRIVSRHGGRVWADAQKGKGATFYFTLGKQACAGD